jgi:hypothetical protein
MEAFKHCLPSKLDLEKIYTKAQQKPIFDPSSRLIYIIVRVSPHFYNTLSHFSCRPVSPNPQPSHIIPPPYLAPDLVPYISSSTPNLVAAHFTTSSSRPSSLHTPPLQVEWREATPKL